MRRAAPAITLFFLSPLIAEFLLGDFTFALLPILVLLAPMYGGGALVIRELTRRAGRGWPTMVLLALAYGVLEEGLTTQSLFDPNYADAHLLDQGFVPALGIAVPWTIFVLALHAGWSISVPIALVEEWTPRRTTPWLRRPGLVVCCLLLALGIFGTTMSSYGNDHYIAAWPKLFTVVLIVIALVVAAFTLPRRTPATVGTAPRAWVVFVVALAAGGLFFGSKYLPLVPAVIGMLVALGGIVAAILLWSRRSGWGAWHRFAAAAAGVLTYAWHSFTTEPLAGGGPVITPISHAFFALAAVVLLLTEARRLRRSQTAAPAPDPAPVPSVATEG
jgi:hypothetical protein